MKPSTYLPLQFKAKDDALAWTLMQEHPLATLISVDDEGVPFTTHLPLHRVTGEGQGLLLGHVAKGNPHWQYLQARPSALVIFRGPQGYLSPTVYPDLVRVPTWNYLAVHCQVEASLIPEAEAKDHLLKQLIAQHEPAYAAQWRSLPTDYQDKMLSAIVGFSLRIVNVESKLKLNQHRPEAHAAMRKQYARGTADEQALAVWMDRLGMGLNP